MKAIVFITILATMALCSSHKLDYKNLKFLQNEEFAQKLVKVFALGIFQQIEAKSNNRTNGKIGPLRQIVTPLPDPMVVEDKIFLVSETVVSGYLSRCGSAITGTASVIDDLSISASIPTEIVYTFDLRATQFAGGHETEIKILNGRLNLLSYGAFTIDLKGFFLRLQLDILINGATGRFSIRKASLDLGFESITIDTTSTTLNGEPFEWEQFNSDIKQAFEDQWPLYKPDVDLIIASVAAEQTKLCNVYALIRGEYDCIGSSESIRDMIDAEISGILRIEERPTCPTPGPTTPRPPTEAPPQEFLLYSNNVTNYGEWARTIDRCPPGTYAQGFQIKNEGLQGVGDDTSMNGLRLFCGQNNQAPSVTSLEGDWGKWRTEYFCPNKRFINGFQMLSEEGGKADDTAANNFRVFCTGNAFVPIQADGNNYGEWRDIQKCGSGYGVCGLKTQVEPYQGVFSDDTALNNVALLCCLL